MGSTGKSLGFLLRRHDAQSMWKYFEISTKFLKLLHFLFIVDLVDEAGYVCA